MLRLVIFALVLITACQSNYELIERESENIEFVIPVIKTDNEIVYPTKQDSLGTSWVKMIGKFRFDEIPSLDSVNYYTDPDRIHESEIWDGYQDSMNSDGLQIIADYSQSLSFQGNWSGRENNSSFYPVFIVNETKENKLFIGKDSRVFAIQEAQDEKNVWYPIDRKPDDFCGNGLFGLIIRPQEYVLFLVPKYDGNYITEMRVRIDICGTVYHSQTFTGKINEGQFYLQKDSRTLKDLYEHPLEMIYWLFLGAIPKDYIGHIEK